ncbi:MAG: hypothetical protein BBJ57_07130 [Desulfobacterales bacterium PC51MH44]|nr:MAG: hypothetical protein BBJ57_07130 [Desulfobacterales bacterium PC51MH44]
MNLKLNIRHALSRKTICIILMLVISIGFSFGAALANSCQGGADCFICADLPHRHVPVAAAEMEDPGCRPAGQNSTCGFETSQGPDEFQGIVSSVRSYHQVYAGIFAVVSDEYGQTLLPKEFVPQFLLSDSGGAAPIYLLNQALLC